MGLPVIVATTPEFAALTAEEVRAALNDLDEDNPIAIEVARLLKAYTANFAEHVWKSGRMPESILHARGASPIEKIAMQMMMQSIRAAIPPEQMLAAIGRALHGEQGWFAGLAGDLQIGERTLRAWLSGRDDLTADHGVFDDALLLCKGRAAQLAQAAKTLRKWLAANRASP